MSRRMKRGRLRWRRGDSWQQTRYRAGVKKSRSMRRTVARMQAVRPGCSQPCWRAMAQGCTLLYTCPNNHDKQAATGGQSILHQGSCAVYLYHSCIGLLTVIDIQFLCASKSPRLGQSPLPEYDPSPTATFTASTTNTHSHSTGTALTAPYSTLASILASSSIFCLSRCLTSSTISITLYLGDHSSINSAILTKLLSDYPIAMVGGRKGYSAGRVICTH